VKRRNEHKMVNMTASEFLGKLKNPIETEHIYYTANVNAIGKLASEIR